MMFKYKSKHALQHRGTRLNKRLLIHCQHRKYGGKIRLSASSHQQSDEDYLTKLVAAMIAEDTIGCGVNEITSTGSTQDYIRILPSICDDFTNPKVKVYKHEFA
jgi:hypothetical protein